MIDVIFTLDYEIYGNGAGTLRELVLDPAARLMEVFRRRNARFVTFVEAAELERIGGSGTDEAIGDVEQQIRSLHGGRFEIALHLHPQWSGARHERGRWILNYGDYNLCTLPRRRIEAIVDSSIGYLRRVLRDPGFTPLAFRAGNWLFQPTRTAAAVLAERGLRIDSSVFKGGVQHAVRLDYRRAARHGHYWQFGADVTECDPAGNWLEIPVHAEMVPCWRMLTARRVRLQATGASVGRNARSRFGRIRDYLRLRYPMKLDFCRMTARELTSVMMRVLDADRRDPGTPRPVVAIGHTKDPIDLDAVDAFLAFLARRGVRVSTFADVYPRLRQLEPPVPRALREAPAASVLT